MTRATLSDRKTLRATLETPQPDPANPSARPNPVSPIQPAEERDPLVINLPAAARLLGISPEHARRLAKAGRMPGAFALGRRHLVSMEGLRRYLSSVGPMPEKVD